MGQKVHPIGFRRGIPSDSEKEYLSHGENFFDRRDSQRLRPHFDRFMLANRYSQTLILEKYVKEIFEKSGYFINSQKIHQKQKSFEVYVDLYLRRGTSPQLGSEKTKEKGQRMRKLTWTPRPLSWHPLKEEDLFFYGKFFEKYLTQNLPVNWHIRHLNGDQPKLRETLSENLARYEKYPFFSDGLAIFQILCQEPASPLLASFIAKELQDFPRHNLFIDFISEGLDLITLRKDSNLLGALLQVKGRASGSDRTKRVQYRKGSLPLQRMSAPIDFGFSETLTSYGRSSIKVWLKYYL